MSLIDARWKGTPGRLEVWYATITDGATGTGAWIHHELVAPSDGRAAFTHGWAALFPPDRSPTWSRYGPEPVSRGARPRLPGSRSSGEVGWDLTWPDETEQEPLFTFPRWAWERDVLPGAQIVPLPSGRFEGSIEVAGARLELRDATGNLARIYGHGNAERWGWLHADLGGGEVLEIVAAAPHRRSLRWVPPVPMVQLRTRDGDWPRHPLAAAPFLRARLGLPCWSVRGVVGRRRMRVEVEIPAEGAVAVPYLDPDGAPATCTNSERAHAEIVLEGLKGRRWETQRQWSLVGTAHAEVGTRP